MAGGPRPPYETFIGILKWRPNGRAPEQSTLRRLDISFNPDPESVFSRGQMMIEAGGGGVPAGANNLFEIEADGNGSVSVEVYLDGVLIGSATGQMSNQPGTGIDLVRALAVKMVPDVPGTPAGSSFDSETGILTCTFGTRESDGDFRANLKIVLTVRGHVDFAEAGSNVKFIGNGMGEVEINYHFKQAKDLGGPI